MCGIAGWLTKNPVEEDRIQTILRMLNHRGPDSDGVWVKPLEKEAQAGLLHTRLSIIDLSEQGAQPMQSECGQFILSFNGEIYNYRELRAELENMGRTFRSRSDTEVLLQAYQEWGTSVFPRLVGMFAVVVVDRQRSMMVLARDPFGVKPLYYQNDSKGLWCASEIPALIALAEIRPNLNLQLAHDYLALGQVDQKQNTFFDNILSFPAAHYVEVPMGIPVKDLQPKRYWRAILGEIGEESFQSSAEVLRGRILESIELHMRSDVPVGACLSGGIDSSAIVCSIRELNPKVELHTFSYVARDSPLSEERWVDEINQSTGAIAHKVYASDEGLVSDLDQLIKVQGEPFGSTSIYAQYCVFQAAKEAGITVMLDGQGTDELFAGYLPHRGALLASYMKRGKFLSAWELLRAGAGHIGQGRGALMKMALHYMMSAGLYSRARKMVGRGNNHPWIDLNKLEDTGVNTCLIKPENYDRDILRQALRFSLEKTFIPQFLRYEDRDSMAHSIESRVPFLTSSLVNFAYSLPDHYLISRGGDSKAILRAAMRGIVPDCVLDRRDKVGFQTPELEWLRMLSMWVDDMLGQAAEFSWLNVDALRKEWRDILAGRKSFDTRVWRWINFLRWAEIFNVR